jgi:predicted transcriptional regulator of viral defense system
VYLENDYLSDFFAQHPLFRTEEVAAYLAEHGSGNPLTRKSLLTHHEKQGHVLRVRRGLYASVPAGTSPDAAPIDPFLLAGMAAPDSVLAYHTALAVHGKTYSVHRQFQFLTETNARPFKFRDGQFRPVRFPKALVAAGQQRFDVGETERSGLTVHVTGLERTMVDVLDRPDLGGGWEQVWRSLESVEFFDLDRVVEYALLLGNATTVAKVGFYLEQHRETLMVEDTHLARLRERRPTVPRYVEPRGRGRAKLLSAWNLLVPVELIERSWEAER